MKKVKEIKTTIINNKIISGSIIILIGSLLGSFTNYLFHVVMARALEPKDYGVLESIISLLYQMTIILSTISLVIIKYVSYYKGKNKLSTINSFFWKLIKKTSYFTFASFILIIILTPFVTKFLNLPSYSLFFIIGLAFLIGIYSTITKSFLQGLSRFAPYSFIGLIEGISKLLVVLVFITMEVKLIGAALSFLISAFVGLLLAIFFMRDIFKDRGVTEPIHEKKDMLLFILPVFLTNLGIISMITSDIILVRHFFNPYDAGIYSALSTLGKIIFFAASPISIVLLPQISENQAANKNYQKIIATGLFMTGGITLAMLIVFGFFPNLMVSLLFGKKYLDVALYVLPFGLAIALYTINTTLLNIFIALKKSLPAVFICLAAILQIGLILFFHSSITEIVNIFIISSALLLITLLVYYAYEQKKTSLSHSPGV